MSHAHPQPATLGQLKASGYRYRSVKQELRENLIARLRADEELFPGVVGYRGTVVPQVAHAQPVTAAVDPSINPPGPCVR